MEEMVAYCGLVCSSCPTFIATQNDDNVARAETAAFYAEKYGFNLKPEDINCDGCLTDGGKLIAYCETCDIRKCCRHDPLKQHWHLGPIGVLPIHQGSGIGSILMECFCNEVDACLAKAYLETDLDKNVRFYEKFGFKVVSETKIFDVKNRYMLRASRV